jgi:uncharacterized membrane protein YvlD (DUF360 family)
MLVTALAVLLLKALKTQMRTDGMQTLLVLVQVVCLSSRMTHSVLSMHKLPYSSKTELLCFHLHIWTTGTA